MIFHPGRTGSRIMPPRRAFSCLLKLNPPARIGKYSPRGENPPRGEAVLCLGFRNSRRRVGGEFWEFPKTRPDKPPQFPKVAKIHVRKAGAPGV